MVEKKVKVGVIGTFLFFATLIGLLYALNAPKPVSYGAIEYDARQWASDYVGITHVSFVLPALLIILLWLGIRKRAGKGLWKQLYLLAAMLAGAYLLLVLFNWQVSDFESVYQSDTAILPEGSDYVIFAEVKGPNRFRSGTSDVITLKMWIDQGKAPPGFVSLDPAKWYTLRPEIRATNFEIDPLNSETKEYSVTVGHSAEWKWVLSPKKETLGTQSILIDVDLPDSMGNEPNPYCSPRLSLRIDVRDPLGLPSSVMQSLIVFEGVLSLPFFTWIYNEWSMRQKEKRMKKLNFSRKQSIEERICPRCGHRNKADSSFCEMCGKKISNLQIDN